VHENATAVAYWVTRWSLSSGAHSRDPVADDDICFAALNPYPKLPDPVRKAVMTIFRLKQIASTSLHAAVGAMQWNYDRAELIADGVVHIIGICFGLVAVTALIVLTAVYASAIDVAAVSVYAAGLLAMLAMSATYNLWPVSPAKWVLRRFDHSAIYLLIAATYTPLIMELKDSTLPSRC